MAQNRSGVAAQAAGASGRGPATEPAPIDVDADAWYIVERGARVEPTFTVSIAARLTIKITTRDVEVEVEHNGITLRFMHEELIIDPRYNVAELRRCGELVAVSNKVRYKGKIYEAREFVALVKKSVKELMEEAAVSIGL